jgi:uncharacterized membrane protein YfhO
MPLIFLACATLLFFWPVWIGGYRFPIGGGDLWGQLYPVWSYIAQWLRRGSIPLWHTGMMAGDPIFSEGQYGLLNPLNWLMFLFSPISAWIISLRVTAVFWLAGAGMFLYLHRSPVWTLSRTAALIGALSYMFSDSFIAHLGHPQFNDAMAWLPWTLWGVDGAVRRKRGIPLGALALSLLMLSGHGQASLYGALTVGLYALWQAFDAGMQHFPYRLGRLLLVGILAAGIVMPAMLPALERLPYTDRANVPPKLGEYEFHLGMWRDYLTPLYHGRNLKTFWGPWDRVESGSIGVVALAFAVWGLTACHRKRTIFLWVMAVTVVLFALGTQAPLYPWLANLPFFDATWKTGRAIYVLSLILAMAAGQGVDKLFSSPRKVLWVIVLLGAASWIALHSDAWAAVAPDAVKAARAVAGLHLAILLLVITALLGTLVKVFRFGRASLVLLVVAELVATGALADVESNPSSQDDPHSLAIAYLRADEGWFRVDVDGAARGLWSPASVMAAGFDVPQGTGNPLEIVAYNQFYWGIPHKGMPVYSLLGAKYIIVPKDALPGGDGIWPVFTQDPLVDIHLNTNALPRVWLVYHTVPVDSLEMAYAYIFSPDFTPASVATVKGGPLLDSMGKGRIEVLAYAPNRASFIVETSERAVLVLSDLLYPGWRVTVDGKKTQLMETNGLFRGVAVPAGSHRIDMRFVPPSLLCGLGMLGMALMTMLMIFLKQRAHDG